MRTHPGEAKPARQISYGRQLTLHAQDRGDDIALVHVSSDGTERELTWEQRERHADRAEVELALSEHPGVAGSVVIGPPDTLWGQRLHALVEPADPECHPTPHALEEHCRQRLATYKVPKAFEIVEHIPRSAAGKINRSALAAERDAAAR